MRCDTPQLLLFGPEIPCGICQGCIYVRRALEKRRRFDWLKRNHGVAYYS